MIPLMIMIMQSKKKTKSLLHVLFERNPKKNYEIRQMKYTPPEKILWFGQFVKLMCSSRKKTGGLIKRHVTKI